MSGKNLFRLIFSLFAIISCVLIYSGCGEAVNVTPDRIYLPITDQAQTIQAQGVHFTGKIELPEIDSSFFIERSFFNDPTQVAKISTSVASATDLSNFTVLCAGQASKCDKTGNYSLSNVPANRSFLITAMSGRIQLKKRVVETLGDGSNSVNHTLNLNSTAVAILFDAAFDEGKYLSQSALAVHAKTAELEELLKSQLQNTAMDSGSNLLLTPSVNSLVKSFLLEI